MTTQNNIQSAFEAALDTYDAHAVVQREIVCSLVDLAREFSLPRQLSRVLEVGCGTGFLTEQLLRHCAVSHLYLNDLVAGSEQRVRDKLSASQAWSFLAGAIENTVIPNTMEMICSASTLQWVSDMQAMLAVFHRHLQAKGFLLISSFAPQHFFELRSIKAQLQTPEKHAMTYWDEPQWHSALHKEYHVLAIQTERKIVQFDSFNELLLHLRLTGVNGRAPHQQSGHRRGVGLRRLERLYREQFYKNGQYPLSYQPIYILAQKRT